MLPSIRLIAATFLCGFVVVFAGLRLASSLNDFHGALPVMAAHAAPVVVVPVADSELRRGQSAVPVMYDLRFAVSSATLAPALVNTAPIIDRTVPLGPPLSILPPEAAEQDTPAPAETAAEPAQPESTVAAIQPDAPITEQRVAPEPETPPAPAPPPEPTVEAAPAPSPVAAIASAELAPETPAKAVVEPAPKATTEPAPETPARAAAKPRRTASLTPRDPATTKVSPRAAKSAAGKAVAKKPARLAHRAPAPIAPKPAAVSRPTAPSGEVSQPLGPYRIE